MTKEKVLYDVQQETSTESGKKSANLQRIENFGKIFCFSKLTSHDSLLDDGPG
jgi:hypothetical protein